MSNPTSNTLGAGIWYWLQPAHLLASISGTSRSEKSQDRQQPIGHYNQRHENTYFAAMEGVRDKDTVKPTFLGEYLPSKGPIGQSSNGLSNDALMALPFVGMFIGVDELMPTKAVYAVYDSSNVGITYVRGDGTFANARQICFTRQFKDSSIPHHRSQRAYLPELQARTASYRHRSITKQDYLTNNLIAFPTVSSVKATLTYLVDLKMESCPALSTFDSTPTGPNLAPPHMSLEVKPTWDFNTGGFQAFTPPGDDSVAAIYEEFKQKYTNVRINIDDFQQALFCLGGMLKAGLIDFLWAGQNTPFYIEGLSRLNADKLINPRRTSVGWTVDCFIARFAEFHEIYCADNTFAQVPNPINWLEAEMDDEARRKRIKVPWEITVKKPDDSVISWEVLATINLNTRGNSKTYPKSLIPKSSQTLLLKDIISSKGKIRENKKARKLREARDKSSRKAAEENGTTIDLTEEDGFVRGHMGRNPDADAIGRPINHNYQVSRAARAVPINGNRANTPPASGRKRIHSYRHGSFQAAFILDDDEDDQEPAHVDRRKRSKHQDIDSDNIYSDSDSEGHRSKKSRRTKSPSPFTIDDFAKHLQDYTKNSAE